MKQILLAANLPFDDKLANYFISSQLIWKIFQSCFPRIDPANTTIYHLKMNSTIEENYNLQHEMCLSMIKLWKDDNWTLSRFWHICPPTLRYSSFLPLEISAVVRIYTNDDVAMMMAKQMKRMIHLSSTCFRITSL